MSNILSLLVIFLIGVVTRNNLLAASAGFVMILGFLNLHQFYPVLERRGIEIGLLFLTITLLVPFATGRITHHDILHTLTSPIGLLAIIGGVVGAYLNGQGIDFVTIRPDIVPGILLGVVICVSFLGGASVGPVMAAGITAVLVHLFFP